MGSSCGKSADRAAERGGLTAAGHQLALRRMEAAGARVTSWIQALLEFQRDGTRYERYEGARSIVVDHGGGGTPGLCQPYLGSFRYYPGRRQQTVVLSAVVRILRL